MTWRAAAWVTVLVEAGVLEEVHHDGVDAVAWHLTPDFVFLLDRDGTQVARRACFAVPAYRDYLVGILAEGLVDAARAAMTAELEEWTRDDLATLIPELNRLLDGLETQERLIDLPPRGPRGPDGGPARARRIVRILGPLSSWAVRTPRRHSSTLCFADSRNLACRAACRGPAAVLRPLPLSREDGFDLGSSLVALALEHQAPRHLQWDRADR